MTSVLAGLMMAAAFLQQGRERADTRLLAAALAECERLRCDEPWFTANYALARLALKKASLLEAGGARFGVGEGRVEEIVADGMAAIERLRHKQLPPLRTGKLMELAYEAANDGSVQPYYLYLPPDYSDDRKWPLIVFLHGYVPTITVIDPWILPDEQCAIAGRNGCMLLIPYGRRNTDFQGVGEVDVLETTRLVCEAFPVDQDRIYISGVSMGGMGAWNMALRHPGMYAAATPMCGQTDMLTWWGWPKDDIAPFKRWLIEWDNPINLVDNLRGQHVFVQHGELDHLIPVEQSRSMVRAAEALGIKVDYYEHKGKSHYIYWENECFERAWSWLPQFRRESSPSHITFVTYSLEYDTAFWTRILAIDKWGEPARVEVRRDLEANSVEITVENVASLALDRSTARIG
ncbi:MAG: prolyl oligopeptidase family serine peptidase, partial [Armatimonadetes bacterium]|nr:prolyl oligopeptidase family serine peptidase [Armatimonadota bacterium]